MWTSLLYFLRNTKGKKRKKGSTSNARGRREKAKATTVEELSNHHPHDRDMNKKAQGNQTNCLLHFFFFFLFCSGTMKDFLGRPSKAMTRMTKKVCKSAGSPQASPSEPVLMSCREHFAEEHAGGCRSDVCHARRTREQGINTGIRHLVLCRMHVEPELQGNGLIPLEHWNPESFPHKF